MKKPNPYDWTRHQPHPAIPRTALVDQLAEQLLEGHGCVLVGGRGMGKSVVLKQTLDRLRKDAPETTSVCLSNPPAPMTLEGTFRAIAFALGTSYGKDESLEEVFRRHFELNGERQGCVLLFDEIDKYVSPRSKEAVARTLLDHIEGVRRESASRIGVLIAGGLGVYALRHFLSSTFLSRAYWEIPSPFTEEEIGALAAPFADDERPLSEESLKSIHLASGGSPALVTYGLQQLWKSSSASIPDVASVYAEMRVRHPDFVRDVRESVAHPDFSEAPLRAWRLIRDHGEPIPRALLRATLASTTDSLSLDVDDVVRLLRSAGLVSLRGAATADPLDLRPVPSIFNLPEPSVQIGSLRQQLVRDLTGLLVDIHRLAPDFFYVPASDRNEAEGRAEPAAKKTKEPKKRMTPEAVFSAVLALGFGSLGWQVEREAQQAAGRTDLKLSRAGQVAIVEVKIWERNDYADIHEQVQGYWSPDVQAGAAVMLTDKELPDFAASYQRVCLSRKGYAVTVEKVEPPIRGRFAVGSKHPDGFDVIVDHLLARVPRG